MNIVDYYNDVRALIFYNLEIPVYSESSYQNSDVTFPCIILKRESSQGDFTFSGVGFRHDVLTLSIKAKSLKQSEIKRDHLISTMQYFTTGTAQGYDGYHMVYFRDSGNFSNNIYTRNVAFNVMYRMPIPNPIPNITSRGGGLGAFLLGQY